MQCCGDPFQVGQQVAWTLTDQPDVDWLVAAAGEDVARRVTHAEDHHGSLPDDVSATHGKVLAISSAFCRYALVPEGGGGKALSLVPGSALLRKAQRATGWEPESPDLRFNGYLVDLRVAEPGA